MTSNSAKGKAFESMVDEVLTELQALHPGSIKVRRQPRINLYDENIVIPDFELRCLLPFAHQGYLIECQNRQRSKPDIAHKIRYVKSLSRRNKFIFVYLDSIPATTKSVLLADGVLVMAFSDFVSFIGGIEYNLSAVQEKDTSNNTVRTRARRRPRPGEHHDEDEGPPDWLDDEDEEDESIE